MRTLRIAGTDFHVGFYVPPGARARLLTNDQDDEDDDSRRFDPPFYLCNVVSGGETHLNVG